MEGMISSILQGAMNINDNVRDRYKYAHGGAAHCVRSASFALRRALEGRSNGAGFLMVSLDPSSVSEVMRKPKATLGIDLRVRDFVLTVCAIVLKLPVETVNSFIHDMKLLTLALYSFVRPVLFRLQT